MRPRLGFGEREHLARVEPVGEALDDLANDGLAVQQFIESGGPAAEFAQIAMMEGDDGYRKLGIRRDPQQPHPEFRDKKDSVGLHSLQKMAREPLPTPVMLTGEIDDFRAERACRQPSRRRGSKRRQVECVIWPVPDPPRGRAHVCAVIDSDVELASYPNERIELPAGKPAAVDYHSTTRALFGKRVGHRRCNRQDVLREPETLARLIACA